MNIEEAPKKPINLSTDDVEKLIDARAILLSSLSERILLKDLVKRSCLNQRKIKEGFKELFGKTMTEIWNEARLEHAKKLLTESQFPIGQIGLMCGYDAQSHFTYSFKKQFGYTPMSVKKARKKTELA